MGYREVYAQLNPEWITLIHPEDGKTTALTTNSSTSLSQKLHISQVSRTLTTQVRNPRRKRLKPSLAAQAPNIQRILSWLLHENSTEKSSTSPKSYIALEAQKHSIGIMT
jgi:hypothetical protein